MQTVMRKPKILKSPKKSVPGDLSSLSGLGAKAKIILNRLGIFYIVQVSQWGAEEINWVHSHSSGSLSLNKLKSFVEQAKIFVINQHG
jgi:predicted flap endonuclease-1-like 5' DNA nuclease